MKSKLWVVAMIAALLVAVVVWQGTRDRAGDGTPNTGPARSNVVATAQVTEPRLLVTMTL
jgi:hypothetical protein